MCTKSAAAAAAAALCVALSLLLQQQCYCVLLLFIIVWRIAVHRVADGNMCCWFIESDSSVFCLQTRFVLDVLPLAVVACTASIRLHHR